MRVPENFVYYLSAHKDCTEKQLRFAEGLTAEELDLTTDKRAIEFRKMVFAVLAETQRMKGFVRLQPMGDFVLYGYLKPVHKIGSRVCDFFARRLPGTLIILGNSAQSWASLCTEDEILRSTGSGLEMALEEMRSALGSIEGDSGVSSADKIWNVYYKSQYCPERRNLRAFHRRMPKKSLISAGLRMEWNKNGLTLSEFFNGEQMSRSDDCDL
jgi:probable DNA metabolism protein